MSISRMLFLVSALVLAVQIAPGAARITKGRHTNNWAVIVNTSRFWFNYRHTANALSVYRSVKQLGIPDSQIILMLADDMACNDRNARPAQIYNNERHSIDLYGDDIEVDYRGYEVTPENLIRVLTGRHEPNTPRSKKLLTDDRSNILIYMTGHGGDEFIKFQDAEEISSHDLADSFEQMWRKGRYNEILFAVDTCQAATLCSRFYSPNIVTIASSRKGEDSLSLTHCYALGVTVIDRWTYYLLDFLEKITLKSQATIHDLFSSFDYRQVQSTTIYRYDLFRRKPEETLLTDFFGQVAQIQPTETTLFLEPKSNPIHERAINRTTEGLTQKREWRKTRDTVEPATPIDTDDTVASSALGPVFYGGLLVLLTCAAYMSWC